MSDPSTRSYYAFVAFLAGVVVGVLLMVAAISQSDGAPHTHTHVSGFILTINGEDVMESMNVDFVDHLAQPIRMHEGDLVSVRLAYQVDQESK